MFSLITDRTRLFINNLGTNDRIKFVGYKIGIVDLTQQISLKGRPFNFQEALDSPLAKEAFVIDNFQQKYQGGVSNISYTPVTADRTILKCITPHDTDTFRYNCVLLIASCKNTEFVFSTQWYLTDNPKFNMEISRGGMVHYFLETIKMTGQADYFDYSNLALRAPTFEEYDDYEALPSAVKSREDQAILKQHLTFDNDGAPHVLFDSEGQWFGSPMRAVDFDGPAKPATLNPIEE